MGQPGAPVELVGAGSARRALVVHDGFVGHEEPDDVGELAGVAEVDRMGGTLDDDQRRQGVVLVGDLPDPSRRGHQRVTVADDHQGRDLELEQPLQGRELSQIPYFGALAPEYKTAMITDPVPDRLFIWRLDRSRMVGVLDLPNSKIGRVEVPLRPFFGTIGTAPGGKECISSLIPGPHGANMDFNEVVEGVTMLFPVFEPGALFMLGDGHAAQGDGEIDGAAIETSFDVTFTVNLIKGKKINWPRLENDRMIMSIGSTRPLIDALRIACVDLVNWMVQDHGYDKYEALQVLGQAAQLEIANVVDPQYSVACQLDKRYLPR